MNPPACPSAANPQWPPVLASLLLVLLVWTARISALADEDLSILRDDTRSLFYHGYTNYMTHAFPEDEIKPLSCKPQTRNRENPADIGINDALGNYSLTLVDSLSTLAILASAEGKDGKAALKDFQHGVKAMAELYGDGREGSCGQRACGFDLDSKVQVFETNIRGVGGLLSAHLFAIGELPIRGYSPSWVKTKNGKEGVFWNHGKFVYDGQLLRLAHDLATRLLPAFRTQTGLPYPRVNLRHGIPFYQDAEDGVCRLDGTSSDPREITETCTAGAGSLVLEFTTLSRLTGDTRFEKLAKRAFWTVWNRRSAIDLVAGGIDAESGQWIMPPLSGIGAGIDSFFEYALKSHILLSGLPSPNRSNSASSPREHDDSNAYLDVWTTAHAAINHHIQRSSRTEIHPYFGQSDFLTGAPRYNWIDNLSAYFPGLLTLAGQLSEAIESHLLFSALWTRYAALPERWHVTAMGGFIDNNFKHWAGRPEFVESTWYLYRATKDPWLVHVGEMVLRDVRRRCWAKCGWAGLRSVLAGEGEEARGDRMESFFLGETAKYLYLLFDEDHPLNGNGVDGVVFSTEGHPLMVPKKYRHAPIGDYTLRASPLQHSTSSRPSNVPIPTCAVPPPLLALTISPIANRPDLFHPAALTHLHLTPRNPARSSPLVSASPNNPAISLSDLRSPTNYTFYPWTLPQSLIPPKGVSSPIARPIISTLTFPDLSALASDGSRSDAPSGLIQLGALQKVLDGVLINSLSNVRLNLVQEPRSLLLPDSDGVLVEQEIGKEFRVSGIANWALGRDEKVVLSGQAMEGLAGGAEGFGGEHFRRVRDLEWVDLVIDVANIDDTLEVPPEGDNATNGETWQDVENLVAELLDELDRTVSTPTTKVGPSAHPSTSHPSPTSSTARSFIRHLLPAVLPTGPGAAPLPPVLEHASPLTLPLGKLPLRTLYFLDSNLCTHTLPTAIAKTYNILVIHRGGCSFNTKLANIPALPPSDVGLQLVIVLDNGNDGMGVKGGEQGMVRPLLDEVQRTPKGLLRRFPLGMVLVEGGGVGEEVLRGVAGGVGTWDGREREVVESEKGEGGGLAVKRRYWFESQGVPIGNLIML